MRKQVVQVDFLLAERAEFRNHLRDRRVQLEQPAFNQRQRKHVGELLRNRHRCKDRVRLQTRAGRAVRIALAKVKHRRAPTGDAHGDAVAMPFLDV
jgi:hypothetical protein